MQKNNLKEERDAWRSCADDLVDYAREALVQLETWGKGYVRYDKERQQIKEAISKYEELTEKAKNGTLETETT
jgi:acyl-CoA reductase-like NAD-dependent aldehyde dehydrogenase